jgi:hypothetical protein
MLDNLYVERCALKFSFKAPGEGWSPDTYLACHAPVEPGLSHFCAASSPRACADQAQICRWIAVSEPPRARAGTGSCACWRRGSSCALPASRSTYGCALGLPCCKGTVSAEILHQAPLFTRKRPHLGGARRPLRKFMMPLGKLAGAPSISQREPSHYSI